jgi:hypothetical protein
MALISTVQEIKSLLPKFISNTTAPDALPNFDQAEYKYLVPITGATLYNSIHTKKNDQNYPANMTADEKTLLKKMQLVACVNAFLDELALGQLVLTENGIKKFAKDDIRLWEYNKLESALQSIAADAQEVLLAFLFEKKFADWTGSDQYRQITRFLIRSGSEFSSSYTLFQPSRTFFAIRSRILDAQRLYLVPSIGEDLLSFLIGKDAPPDGLKKSLDALRSALAFFSIKQSCQHDTVRFTDAGFTVLAAGSNDSATDAGRINADNGSMNTKIQACDTDGNAFLKIAEDELVKYYKSQGVDVDFKAAFEKGPLVNYVNPSDSTSGNERRKGVFRL